MTAPKRIGRDSATRKALIQATAQIMLEEGYAAATSRRVAAKAGVKPALVHYYFPSMDDLFLAVLRAGAEVNLDRQREALADDQPLRERPRQLIQILPPGPARTLGPPPADDSVHPSPGR